MKLRLKFVTIGKKILSQTIQIHAIGGRSKKLNALKKILSKEIGGRQSTNGIAESFNHGSDVVTYAEAVLGKKKCC